MRHTVHNILVHFSRKDRRWTQRLVLWFYFKWQYLRADQETRAQIDLTTEILNELEQEGKI